MSDNVAVHEGPTQQDIVKDDSTVVGMDLLVDSSNPLSGGESYNEGPTSTANKNPCTLTIPPTQFVKLESTSENAVSYNFN
ncbi:hypothetical protein G3I44_09545 [Halogeometricum borinquense]|uniref:Uncharacterized protein n=1 Tax=Halogeometricum borinquense TaxID=60847 RepID=A0A6C0UJM6_9EURY|nr:hypothetical protein [Halogeometricum borinquense]QIB74501.1 hypothetical protein G3I44_09545 [Halogeometricum borinquense]